MRKKIATLLLALLLALCAGSALAQTAAVDGHNSTKVHLRAGAGTNTDSLGLFFTGTRVECLSDMSGEWTRVRIEAQTGYIMTRYLTTRAIASQQPTAQAVVSEGHALNLHAWPDDRADCSGTIGHGEIATVLGETHEGWYLIDCGGERGYIRARHLSLDTDRGYETARIDGGNADRVHLRAGAGANTDSLGLFFTGTPVKCLSDMSGTWTRVRVGAQAGYIMTRYLTRGSVASEQPAGTVAGIRANSSVNVRQSPEGDVIARLHLGDAVTVLGETHEGWYLVSAKGFTGYITSRYLDVED